MNRTPVLFALGLLLSGAVQPSHPDPLDTFTITVSGARNDTGIIGVALFNEDASSTFPEAEPFRSASGVANSSGLDITFEDLPAGRYAIAVIHDENENGVLDSNDYGMPVEGFGFSNNVMGEMGPPSFTQAAVTVDGETRTAVSLIYMGER